MSTPLVSARPYCESLYQYRRRKTIDVHIGDLPMGSNYPIRVQSMTTVTTMDTAGTVAQALRMVESGCDYVRVTAPSIKEAQNLGPIREEMRKRGCTVPLIADIHFTPNAAELAARLVEKVRINPGNYADKKRFETIEYTDDAYRGELDRIRGKFEPLVKICKEYGTAMRIGTNHGSLSDRIMSRYGDTPLGMVESALEFLRICEDMDYFNIVLSMKASNPVVMAEAYRLLVSKLDEEGFKPYPLHLGVTEAGDGEDGRIKSSVGIGTLLEDGLGDTVRVSLTEEPEVEAPVGRQLVNRYGNRSVHTAIEPISENLFDPFHYTRRTTHEVANIGGITNPPRVIADLRDASALEYNQLKSLGYFYLPATDKWFMNDQGADYAYLGKHLPDFMLPNGLKAILDFETWKEAPDKVNMFPMFDGELSNEMLHPVLNFVLLQANAVEPAIINRLSTNKNLVVILTTENDHAMAALRRAFMAFIQEGSTTPVIIGRQYESLDQDLARLYAATDIGGLLIDGLGDGVMLTVSDGTTNGDRWRMQGFANRTAFGILQATRSRMSKTEYISCPSCGRTLFDLQETTAMIRGRTEHLKGVKIGIMGCIVNGPGEMADADYGYVGSGPGRITLYRGKEVVKRNVPSAMAVDELIQLIREDGIWLEPNQSEGEAL